MSAEQILDRLYELLGPAVVLLPIPLKEKGPKEPGWQELTFAQSQERYFDLLKVVKRGGNLGVLLGPASNRLFALDLDDDQLIEQWLDRAPWLADTLRSKGKRGCQFWLRLEDGCDYPNGKAVYPLKENNEVIGELRIGGSGGAQSVIFGVHPAGMRYQIVVEKPPLVISASDLDELAPGLIFGNKQEESAPVKPATSNCNPPLPADMLKRVERYLDTCDPAVSGQRGHDTTFRVLCNVINGFALSPEDAWLASVYYNQKCEPPWSEKDLRHKVDDALKEKHDRPRGHLLENDFAYDAPRASETPLSKRLKEEQAQAEQTISGADDDHDGGKQSGGEPIDLEKDAEERLRKYTTDPEPFPPSMRPEAFHGVTGEIVNLMAQHCESSREVLLLHGLVIVGNIIGRSAYAYGGGPKLFPNEFMVAVGETARGRKGTALQMWEQLIELVNPDWLEGCLSGQLQSGEGIVSRVRDEQRGLAKGKKQKSDEPLEEVLLDEGVSDKRLLIKEEEFSHALKMTQRSGNTLSETLRQAWDSPRSLRTENKNSRLKASDPHVSLIGHTTRDELAATLNDVDLNNGMANRVLWCAARRTGDMPNAEPIDWGIHPEITERLKQVFHQRPANTDEPKLFSRTLEAKNYWDGLYRKLNAGRHNSTIDNVLARDTSHILKLSLIFAVADQTSQIGTQHLKAALAVIDFCQDSARWIFGKATGNKLANNILVALRREPAGLTRTQVQNDVCYGKTPKSRLDTAFAELVKNGLAKMILEEVPKGPRAEHWFATA